MLHKAILVYFVNFSKEELLILGIFVSQLFFLKAEVTLGSVPMQMRLMFSI